MCHYLDLMHLPARNLNRVEARAGGHKLRLKANERKMNDKKRVNLRSREEKKENRARGSNIFSQSQPTASQQPIICTDSTQLQNARPK